MANPSSTSTSSTNLRSVAGYLYLSAAITIVVGILLGFVVGAVWFAVVAIGLIDGALAYAFSSGRFSGSSGALDPAAESDTTAEVEADPSYNPYARED